MEGKKKGLQSKIIVSGSIVLVKMLSVGNVSNEVHRKHTLYSHAVLGMLYVASKAALAPSRPIPRIYMYM